MDTQMKNQLANLKIHLIRHGETAANRDRLFYGFSDIPLCDVGKQDLIKLKNKYANTSTSRKLYITSGLKRTNETLELLFGDVNFTVVEDFKEMNFGDFELKSHKQLENNEDYKSWINNFEEFVLPNGESKKIFETRVVNAFENLKQTLFFGYDEIYVVAHNGVICVLMDYLFEGLYNKKFYDWKLENGESYIINYNNLTNEVNFDKY